MLKGVILEIRSSTSVSKLYQCIIGACIFARLQVHIHLALHVGNHSVTSSKFFGSFSFSPTSKVAALTSSALSVYALYVLYHSLEPYIFFCCMIDS